MHIRNRVAAALAVMLATAPLSTNAAKITYNRGTRDNIAGISIIGSIDEGDEARFDNLLTSMPEKNAIGFLTSLAAISWMA
jgi:hypothetical protein